MMVFPGLNGTEAVIALGAEDTCPSAGGTEVTVSIELNSFRWGHWSRVKGIGMLGRGSVGSDREFRVHSSRSPRVAECKER